MSQDFIVNTIKHLPLLEKLPPEQLQALAEGFRVLQFQPNDVIYGQGQPARGLYYLVSGRGYLMQRQADGREVVVGEMGANQFIGEPALFKELMENTSLRVVEQATVLFLSRERLQAILAQHPEIQANLNSPHVKFPEPRSKALFEGQRPNEVVLLMQRRHPWVIVRQSFLPIMLIPILLVAIMAAWGNATMFLLLAALVIPAFWIFYNYREWTDDLIIITDERVIRIENNLITFRSNISEMPIHSVHEVNVILPPADLFARIFGYGIIEIKNAGGAGNVRLRFVKEPEVVQKVIFKDKEDYQRRTRQQNRGAIRSEIDKFLEPDKQPDNNPPAPTGPDDKPAEHVSWLSTRFKNASGDMVYRKHLSVWFTHIFWPAVIVMGGFLLLSLGMTNLFSGAARIVELIAGFFVTLVGGIWFYWADWDWRHDLYMVGDSTIRLIHRRPLWLQNINDQILLTQVDNVISDKRGIMDTLLDRGDVYIALVGDEKGGGKVFKNVYQPDEVQEEVSRRRAGAIQREKDAEIHRQHQVIAEYLDVYHERVREGQNNQPVQPQQPAPPSNNRQEPPPAPPIRGGSRPPRIPRTRN